ncbi:MAG: GIY-YIG nuclease family protein [bacterium]|nr:GIY-YIG nuclease family protein [bacterium]
MPNSNILPIFFYVYILHSQKDSNNYIGYTTNLRRRLEEHRKGYSFATKFRLPFKLIYSELCCNEQDAKQREKYLKTTKGRRFLAKRLRNWLLANRNIWHLD